MNFITKPLLFVALSFIALATCAEINQLALFYDAKASTNLQQIFLQRTAKFNRQSKNLPKQELDALSAIIDECDDLTRQNEFAYITNNPATNSASTFEDSVAQVFVRRFLKSDDTNSMKRLLSTRCPEYILFTPIEFVLARAKGPEAISLLLDAYSLAGTNYSSQMILKRLGCAFPLLRREHKGDKDFIAACRRWIKENRNECILNPDYVQPMNLSPPEIEKWRNQDLFITKQ